MRTHRLALFVPVALAALVVAGCRSNTSSDTEAPVFITAEPTEAPVASNMTSGLDVTVPTLTFHSRSKSPSATLSQQDDVILDQWVVTCTRTDGGTVASPQWTKYRSVYVPNGGTATLSDTPIFPFENYSQPPLYQLFPQNGGFDNETGSTDIRQRLHVEIFGKTVAGKKVSTSFDLTIDFFAQ